jgi:hypothetical protein
MSAVIKRTVRLCGEARIRDLAAGDNDGFVHHVAVWTPLERGFYFIGQCGARASVSRGAPAALSSGKFDGSLCPTCWAGLRNLVRELLERAS